MIVLYICASCLLAAATPQAPSTPKVHVGHALDHEVLDGVVGLRLTRIVPRSPADQAGLRRGDRLIAIDGEALDFANELDYAHYVLGLEPGAKLRYTILREGKEKSVTLVTAPFPEGATEAYLRYYRDLVDCHEHGKCEGCSQPKSARQGPVKTLGDWLEEDGLQSLQVERLDAPGRWRVTSAEVAILPQDPSAFFNGEMLEQIYLLEPGEAISYALEKQNEGFTIALEDIPEGLPMRMLAARKAANR
ncbi:MAG: PDZ domain-containing protein [Acidobacteriota bacterium]